MEPIDLARRPEPVNVPAAPGPQFDPQLVEVIRAVQLVLAGAGKGAAVAAEAKREEPKQETKAKKPEDEVPLFWKLCSAALLSVSALIVVTLYNQLNATATQLGGDVGQARNELGQLRTELVPKDDYNLRIEQIVNGIKDVQASNKAAAEAWRERLQEQKATVGDLRQQIKNLERELQAQREELALLEQRAGMPPKSASPPKEKRGP
jgi:hypothetical protein